ncbi:hypothetical protein V4X81_003688, partial [Acinetobacter baumannii]
VKDIKRSIRDKYKRRETGLRIVLEDFIIHANDRIDESRAGVARNSNDIKLYIQKCQELLDVLPEIKEPEFNFNLSLDDFYQTLEVPKIVIENDSNELSEELFKEFEEQNRDFFDQTEINK